MNQRKREREAAAREELERRARARRDLCPLDRDAFEALFEFVAAKTHASGSARSELNLTKSWLAARGLDPTVTISFLAEQDVYSDWDLLVSADPCRLFGTTPTRLARMPLDAPDLVQLLSWLEDKLEEHPCQHNLLLTRQWLLDNTKPTATTEFALIAQGGGCDCEVVMNVEPENIYPPDLLDHTR